MSAECCIKGAQKKGAKGGYSRGERFGAEIRPLRLFLASILRSPLLCLPKAPVVCVCESVHVCLCVRVWQSKRLLPQLDCHACARSTFPSKGTTIALG